MITAGKDCIDCIYYEPIDKFYSRCTARDKRYHYGQWVPCNDKKSSDIQAMFEQKEKEIEEKILEEEMDKDRIIDKGIKKERTTKTKKKTTIPKNTKKKGEDKK